MNNILGLINDTLWCGSGNVSGGLNELGPNYSVDLCCRSHYLCNEFIEPGEEKYGLRNDGRYTLVNCDCEDDFFNCLNSINTQSSIAVITGYSSTYPACFRHTHEIVCQSHDDNYNDFPCKGYRETETNLCSIYAKKCKIFGVTDQFIKSDSQFRLYQEILDRQKQLATTRPK